MRNTVFKNGLKQLKRWLQEIQVSIISAFVVKDSTFFGVPNFTEGPKGYSGIPGPTRGPIGEHEVSVFTDST